jgi:hypothetical protein
LLTLIEQTALDLFQCQIGFLPNQLKQPVLVFLQRRSALAFDRFGLKTPGFPASASPGGPRSYPQSQTAGPPPVPLPWSICHITPPGPDQPTEIEFEDSLRFDLSVDRVGFG